MKMRRSAWLISGLVFVLLSMTVWSPTGGYLSGDPRYAPSFGFSLAAVSHDGGLVSDSGIVRSILADCGAVAVHSDGGLTGRGVKVAVVDTGVDPCALTGAKIVDWVDLTSEGLVELSKPIKPDARGRLVYEGKTYEVRGVKSVSGAYRVGTWYARHLPESSPLIGAIGPDVTMSVLVADNYLAGQYDAVYIDTDCDGSFADEKGLEVYRNSLASVLARFPRTGQASLAVVVADILDNGERVLLGFDGHGHGTAVGGIVTGAADSYRGIAPDASLVAIKAVPSSGETSWAQLRSGLQAAVEEGAGVVVISSAPADPGQAAAFRQFLETSVAGRRDCVVVLPAGNAGPGAGTLPDYAGIPGVLLVGGCVPDSVAGAIGWSDRGGLWPWSSCGPNSQGLGPDIVAAALAPVLSPVWMGTAGNRRMFEGTSCSAAYAGGGAALLMEHLYAQRIRDFRAERVIRALREGAVPLWKVTAAEQGKGTLRVDVALRYLEQMKLLSRVRTALKWDGQYLVNGFLDRNKTAGQVPVIVDNFSPFPLDLNISCPDWVRPETFSLGIPAAGQRGWRLDLETPAPGLYSGYVTGDDFSLPGNEMEILITNIVPRKLAQSKRFALQSLLAMGSVHREFVQVPDGLEFLDIGLAIGDTKEGSPRGRARIYVYDGSGQCVLNSEWIGAGTDNKETVTCFPLPRAGVWEICILSDPMARTFGAEDALFRLEVIYGGVLSTEAVPLQGERGMEKPMSTVCRVENLGGAFEAQTALVVPDWNGHVVQENLLVSGATSTAKALPTVTADTSLLYVSACVTQSPGSVANVYLYWFDQTNGKWVEVAASNAGPRSDYEIILRDPPPGRYMAYIDTSGGHGRHSLQWTVVLYEEDARCLAKEESSSSSLFTFEEGATASIALQVASEETNLPEEAYFVLFDSASGSLKLIARVLIVDLAATPLVNVFPGTMVEGKTLVTIRAWDPTTMRPVDPCVQLDGIWYQLHKGMAHAITRKERVSEVDVRVRALYPITGLW